MRGSFRAVAQRIDLWLLLAVSTGAALRFSRLGDFDNQYYTATVVSMLKSPHNFLFASFDPGGVVTVDKPPFSFWIQAIPVALFGPSRLVVTLPQAIAGTFAIVFLYLVIKPAFGRVAAVAAAFVLGVIPASVVIDSRNEPDSLLSFTLLLAALSIIRAAQTGRWRWLIAFATLMGIGFNTKMLVAFVPLLAFLVYYVLAANKSIRQLAFRTAFTVAVLLMVSFSWVTAIALTPTQDRPYIGSTRDNSIWTLTFKYNGLDRLTSFIGPRPRLPVTQMPQAGPPGQPSQQQQLLAPGYPPPQMPPFGNQPQGQPPPPTTEDSGILGLFTGRLAAQMGWLLPLALFMLLVILVPLLDERVYRHPRRLFELLRETPAASQTVLWGGWFLTAIVVFGLADATTTHPYYLVGMAIPLAAVVGTGFALLWQAFRKGGVLAWSLPGFLVGIVVYQVTEARRLVGDWAVAVLLVATPIAVLAMAVALWRRVAATALATAFVAIGALSALLLPGASAVQAGGPIAGPSGGLAGLQPPRINPEQSIVRLVSSFTKSQGDAGSMFAVGVINAREAAPFIIADVPAVAIGGFSGGDPVFTPDSFRSMAQRGELRYFLMSPQGEYGSRPGAPGSPQQSILDYVRHHWEDISRAAGLPHGTLYRYRAS